MRTLGFHLLFIFVPISQQFRFDVSGKSEAVLNPGSIAGPVSGYRLKQALDCSLNAKTKCAFTYGVIGIAIMDGEKKPYPQGITTPRFIAAI